MHVLIVDDHAPVRQVLRRLVEAEGHTVVEAGDAESALRVAGREDIAIALCDVYLPGRNGLWLAAALSALRPEIAVVLTTGSRDIDVVVAGLQAGVVDYVAKPFSRQQLSSALQRAVFVHASRRAQTDVERELEAHRVQLAAAVAELQQSGALIALANEMFSASDRPLQPVLACA